MAGKVAKTNAMRLLEARRIPYEPLTYSPEIHSADVVAETLGLPPSQVYKTLVVLRERGRPLLVMVAGDRELDTRALARAVGEKRVEMAPKKEAERLTGLQVGGIGALALLDKHFDVYIDRRALTQERILVNGGQRGLNLRLRVADLVAVTGAKVVETGGE
jgi:Cys-tRNA(Pro)/Cys-tRNA(Cys) deacylase